MSNKLGQSPRRTRIPLSGILGGRQRPTLCQRRALTKHCGVSAPLHVFLLLLLSFERRSGNPPPSSSSSPSRAQLAAHRPTAGFIRVGSPGIKAVSPTRSCLHLQPGTPGRPLCVLTGMSAPTQPSHDILAVNRGADASAPASNPPDNPRVYISTPPDLAAVPLSSGC